MIPRNLLGKLLEQFPHELEEVQASRRYRSLLRYRKTGLMPFFNEDNKFIEDMRGFRKLNFKGKSMGVWKGTEWFELGVPLAALPDLLDVITQIRASRR